MSWASRPELIAEAIVHESDHQLFYAYTRRAVLWDEPLESQACIYRSPWRDDPRPLDGLLRGASAFIRVGEFAGALLDMLELRTREYDWAGQRAVLTIRQSIDAVSVIRHHGVSLSQTGRDVVESLDNRARRMLDMIALWPGFETWRNSAIQKELEHDIAWRERHQNSHQDQINLR
jgi:HEXXH motif-containing protein